MVQSPSPASAPSPSPWPVELRLRNEGRLLRVTFDNGSAFDLDAEYLRVESPSAEVRGHAAAEKKIEVGKSNVAIRDLFPMGNYAVRISFDDGHSTGLYSWDYLHELGSDREKRWSAYLAALAARGWSR